MAARYAGNRIVKGSMTIRLAARLSRIKENEDIGGNHEKIILL